ncbi:MAG: flagellar hook-length control protein FliK [Thermodesulfobacteriota bacterium]
MSPVQANSSSSSMSRVFAKMPKFTVHTASSKGSRNPIPLNITGKLIARADQARGQNTSSTSPATTSMANFASQSWQGDLRSQALRLLQGSSQKTAATAAAATQVQVEMPPQLQALVDFLNQQPNQALQVPADRVATVQNFLLQAGLPAEQVESLVNSPRFQEMGLTATDVKSAWMKATQKALQESATALDSNLPLTSGQLANLQTKNITKQPDYQKMWQDLTLPAKDLPSLRLQLQQLGVQPETVQTLNEQKFPNGISLDQVWELIQQAPKSSPVASTIPMAANTATIPTAANTATIPTAANTATQNNVMASPPLLAGGQDLDNWRQLLVKAGMDQELAQSLTSASTPTNQEELRTTLLQLVPPASQPESQDMPKPQYLPTNLRVRQIPVLQQANVGQGQEGGSGNSVNLGLNFGSASKPQEANLSGTTELNNFLTLLTGDASPKSEQPQATSVLGGTTSTVHAPLTPEAREALWSQVQTGILANLRSGENRVTLTLNPPEMGKLNLTLNLKGGMVEVAAVTTHAAVAEAATAGVQQLSQALNQQGLILTQFQFHHQDEAPQGQSQLTFFQNQGEQRQAGKKDGDKWEQPHTPRRQRWAGGIDCFA